jgi:hypothetical protein
MTLIEFLHPLKGSAQKNLVLGTLFYFKRYKEQPAMPAADIKAAMRQAKVPKAKAMNVNAVINSAAPYVHSTGADDHGSFLFEITGEGEKYIREKLGLNTPEAQVEHDVSALEAIAAKTADETVRGYIEEAVTCLRAGALRAAVVFLWTGAVRALQEKALDDHAQTLNPAIQKHDPKARAVTKIDDYAYIKDKTFLLACGDIGLLDKGERSTLEDALNVRNRCGHPTKYKPGVNKAASFVEDVVGIVWP